jgi:hypothetical protein
MLAATCIHKILCPVKKTVEKIYENVFLMATEWTSEFSASIDVAQIQRKQIGRLKEKSAN